MQFSGLRFKKAIRLAAAFAFAGITFISGSLKAQTNHPVCGTDANWQQNVKENPTLLKLMEAADAKAAEYSLSKTLDTSVRIIPVVFHVIHTYGPENVSKQTILDQIAFLNDTYRKRNSDLGNVRSSFKSLIADMRIEFRLATKDPGGKCTDGIERIYSSLTEGADNKVKKLSQWDQTRYLNIWVVKSINLSSVPGKVLGFSSFPWEAGVNPENDGIVLMASYCGKGQKTLTHEAGHFLGLYHTFQDSCSASGDRVGDTPPSANATFGCNTSRNSCHNDAPDVPDMIENFMDYSDCTFMFTAGQKTRVDGTFITYRSLLTDPANLTKTGVNSTSPPTCQLKADFYTSNIKVCQGKSLTYFDASYNGTPNSYSWSFNGGNPASASVSSPVVTYWTPGKYETELTVTNAAGSNTTKKTIIEVVPNISGTKTPMVEGFENLDAAKSGWQFNQDANSTGWQVSNIASKTGSKGFFLDNWSGLKDVTYTFIVPAVDFSTASDPRLQFQLAYAQVNSSSYDNLIISVSGDCGETYTKIYNKSDSRLATTTYKSSSFIPKATDWRQETVSMSQYTGIRNLFMKFELTSKGGNNIFIDDLNIGMGIVGIENNKATDNVLDIYPNPASDAINIYFDAEKSGTAVLEVFDISGKRIFVDSRLAVASGSQEISFTKAKLNIIAGGIYYVRLGFGDAFYRKKLVITE